MDFTLFFRCLARLEGPLIWPASGGGLAEAAAIMSSPLGRAFYKPPGPKAAAGWRVWLDEYAQAVAEDGRPAAERAAEMAAANPAVVLRGWMAEEAYEAAEAGDFGPARQLLEALRRPYQEPAAGEAAARFADRTPDWARGVSGTATQSSRP